MTAQQETAQTQDFESFISSQALPVLCDFRADWCGPCKLMEPVLKDLAREFKGRLTVIKVDTEKKPHLASRYQVSALPTLILFKDGREAHRIRGALSLPLLKRELESRL